VVDLPATFGPRKPVTRPGPDGEAGVVDGHGLAVALGEVPRLDHHSPFPRSERFWLVLLDGSLRPAAEVALPWR
jgi:hypothetical protein